jgi:phosphate transport system protein
MREEFRADLGDISRMLVSMAEGVRAAMNNATTALLTPDESVAELVIARDAEINATFRMIEDKVYALLAQQAPVASDLRLILTALHAAADLERMGDLATLVARTARRRLPNCAVPEILTDVFREMGEVADRIAGKIATALDTSDVPMAARLERDDDVMDDLHRQLFAVMFSDKWTEGTEAAVDTALLGRFYERYADHAVNVGQHVVFLVTGEALHR